MKIGSIDLDDTIMIVAEIGNNHEGCLSIAEEMIGRAAEADADAVKFQTIDPVQLVSPSQGQRLKQLESFQLSEGAYCHLADVARRENIEFLSTPFYMDAVPLLADLVPAFKIASGDNDFIPLIEAVAGTCKPILLSTGMSDLETIRTSVQSIDAVWQNACPVSNKPLADIVLMHCVSSYPTFPRDANIGFMGELSTFNRTLGYSDHTIGYKAAMMSVALGARVIEKHFTLDKNYSDFRDHKISCDPVELKDFCSHIREADLLVGEGAKQILQCERSTHDAARRSIVASRDLRAGEVLNCEDLTWLRPRVGSPPGHESDFLGRTLKISIPRGEPVALGHLV